SLERLGLLDLILVVEIFLALLWSRRLVDFGLRNNTKALHHRWWVLRLKQNNDLLNLVFLWHLGLALADLACRKCLNQAVPARLIWKTCHNVLRRSWRPTTLLFG